jgi:hypothetical protein
MRMIKIDTSRYEAHHGKPKGKRFWAFTIVSPSITTKDKFVVMPEAMTFQQACERVRGIAAMRRSDLIVLEPD